MRVHDMSPRSRPSVGIEGEYGIWIIVRLSCGGVAKSSVSSDTRKQGGRSQDLYWIVMLLVCRVHLYKPEAWHDMRDLTWHTKISHHAERNAKATLCDGFQSALDKQLHSRTGP